MPIDHQKYVNLANLLAAYFVMEAGGIVTRDRKENLLNFLGLDPKRLEEVSKNLNWRRAEESNTTEVLDQLLTGRKSHLANLHAVEILKTAFLFAAREHGDKLLKRLLGELFRLGNFCQLRRFEVLAVYESVTDRKLEEQERWE